MPFFSSYYGFLLRIFTMCFIIFNNVIKKSYLNNERSLRAYFKILALSFLTIISFISFFLRYYIPKLPISSISFLIFIMVQTRLMRRTLVRLHQIIESIWGILTLGGIVILLSAFLIRLYTFGKNKVYKIMRIRSMIAKSTTASITQHFPKL